LSIIFIVLLAFYSRVRGSPFAAAFFIRLESSHGVTRIVSISPQRHVSDLDPRFARTWLRLARLRAGHGLSLRTVRIRSRKPLKDRPQIGIERIALHTGLLSG
jgi:hypothetical protein